MKKQKQPPAKPKPKPTAVQKAPPPPPPKIIIRNAPPSTPAQRFAQMPSATSEPSDASERPGLGACVRENAVGVGVGAVATLIGGTVVYKGWLGPKLTAGIIAGSGIIAGIAGHYLESENLSSVGAGLGTFGTALLVASIAIEGNEYVAKKQAEKRQRVAEAVAKAEHEKRIEAARELLKEEARKGNVRNGGRRVVILDDDGKATEIREEDLQDQRSAA